MRRKNAGTVVGRVSRVSQTGLGIGGADLPARVLSLGPDADEASGQHQALALGLWHRITKLPCGVDPEFHRVVDVP